MTLSRFFVLDLLEKNGRGCVWEFLPSAAGDAYYISTVITSTGQPQRCFLAVNANETSRPVGPVLTVEEPEKFDLRDNGIFHVNSSKFLCAEARRWGATRDAVSDWEKMTLEACPAMDAPIAVLSCFTYEESFKARIGSCRFGKTLSVVNPGLGNCSVTFGDVNSNWEFVPNAAQTGYYIRSLVAAAHDGPVALWYLTADRQDGGQLKVASRVAEDDAFSFEPDAAKEAFAIRHLGSKLLVAAEPGRLRANRQTKGEWEFFTLDLRLHEERPPAPPPRSSGIRALGKSSAAATAVLSKDSLAGRRGANERFVASVLDRKEHLKEWQAVHYVQTSLAEAKKLAQTTGKPLYLSAYTLDAQAQPCLGARMWRCTVLADPRVHAWINDNCIPVLFPIQRDVSTELLGCLNDHSRFFRQSEVAKKHFDSENLVFVDSQGHSHLLGFVSMLQMDDLEAEFSSDSFLIKMRKFEAKIEDVRKKSSGHGGGLFKQSGTKLLSVKNLLKYKKFITVMPEMLLDHLASTHGINKKE